MFSGSKTSGDFKSCKKNALKPTTSWWLNHPIEKYATVKLDHFPNFRDEHKKHEKKPPPRTSVAKLVIGRLLPFGNIICSHGFQQSTPTKCPNSKKKDSTAHGFFQASFFWLVVSTLFWKILVKMEIFNKFSGSKFQKYLSCHHYPTISPHMIQVASPVITLEQKTCKGIFQGPPTMGPPKMVAAGPIPFPYL